MNNETMENQKTIEELENKFLELRIENEQRISKAEQKTTDAVSIIFTWGIPFFALLFFGIVVAAFVMKIMGE